MSIGNSEWIHVFQREDAEQRELIRVLEIASLLRKDLDSYGIKKKIAQANVHGSPSHAVQECIIDSAIKLGFESEKKGLFSTYKTANLRPDYYLKLSNGRGIILEVERGKTLANNMDLLDIWKCHICHEAQHLFLLVPILRPDRMGRSSKVFQKVVSRIHSFFIASNYINVSSVVVFGY